MYRSNVVHPIIVIPVYNGRGSVLKLLDQIKKVTQHTIMIIDDGSTDGLDPSMLPGVVYLKHQSNRGKGAALKTAFNECQRLGYSHALTLDADGQHAPELIQSFIARSLDSPEALVVGARDLITSKMPLHRRLSNNITSQIMSLKTGFQIRDVQVGYRCYPLSDSRLWLSIEDGFQFEADIFFNVRKLKIKLIWQPIPVIYGTEDSHMHLVLDTLRFVRTFFRSFKC
ncbi:MAG: glycosyltransferase family 2 protein [Candidatus Marinimicrobia bacterium]|nr:glycosyltransferase family 2 protein [Candidatus Neomarinimicrobiota bacterium]